MKETNFNSNHSHLRPVGQIVPGWYLPGDQQTYKWVVNKCFDRSRFFLPTFIQFFSMSLFSFRCRRSNGHSFFFFFFFFFGFLVWMCETLRMWMCRFDCHKLWTRQDWSSFFLVNYANSQDTIICALSLSPLMMKVAGGITFILSCWKLIPINNVAKCRAVPKHNVTEVMIIILYSMMMIIFIVWKYLRNDWNEQFDEIWFLLEVQLVQCFDFFESLIYVFKA